MINNDTNAKLPLRVIENSYILKDRITKDMTVRAKFKVDNVTRYTIETHGTAEGGSVGMYPVTSGSEENEKFFKYTPGGYLNLSTINLQALDQFNVGDEFYLDLTKCV